MLINKFCRQGETWYKLRSLLTPELTSAKTMQRFLPELKNVADDFNLLLTNSRDENGEVEGLESLTCRMGLESKIRRI
jgi:ecdysone 20-monooxygenase